MLLEVDNLCFSYYKKPLCLKDVNLSLLKGQKVLILGAKDTGKTTLIKILSGYETSYFGSVLLRGEQVKKISDENKNVSLLLSEPVVLKNKSIRKNIDYFCQVLKINNYADDELKLRLKDFYITRDPSEKMKKLNLAEQRRFAMMRSYLKNPNLIFLDDQFEKIRVEDEQEIASLYKKLLDDKELSVICAINDETFLKQKELFLSIKFDDIIFLSLAKSFHYKDFNEFFNDAPLLDAVKFMDDYIKLDADILLREGEYFICFNGQYKKLDSVFYPKFKELNLVDGFGEQIFIAYKNNVDIFNISDKSFNELINNNEIFVYLSLDESRLI